MIKHKNNIVPFNSDDLNSNLISKKSPKAKPSPKPSKPASKSVTTKPPVKPQPKAKKPTVISSKTAFDSIVPSSIYFASLKGHRPRNEDKHIFYHDKFIKVFGICDGHGSDKVSSYLSELIPVLFANHKFDIPINPRQVYNIYSIIQKSILNKPFGLSSGSTCILVIVSADNLWCINVGDSRAVLFNGSKPLPLSSDHKPIMPSEKSRIINNGGKITYDGVCYRINGLSLSRSFGDGDSPFTPPKPDILSRTLTSKDKFFIIGCDGLFDVIDNNSAVNFVLFNCYDENNKRINKKINIADKLAHFAIQNGSDDNVSVIVVFLD